MLSLFHHVFCNSRSWQLGYRDLALLNLLDVDLFGDQNRRDERFSF